MKKIKKILQNIFKVFFYKAFLLFHGKIKGKIGFENNKRIDVKKIKKNNNHEYKVYKITNGRLYTDRIHDTAIILDNFIVEGPSYQLRKINKEPSGIDNDKVEKSIVFEKGTPRFKKKIKGSVLSLLTGGAGNDNYWHWLFDVLPRIGLYEDALNIDDINYFLLPDYKTKFQKQTLSLLNIPEEKCISSRDFRHISSDKIIVTDHPYVISKNATNDIQNMPAWISDWLRKKYLKNLINIDSYVYDKIYIDRKDSFNSKHLRLIKNEKDVKELLNKNNFKSVVLSDYTFSDQIKIFNNAKVIAGLHGAGFANMCFCKPKTKIIEFKSNTAGKMIEDLAIKNNLVYESISSDPLEFRDKQSGHIVVSIDLLKKIIQS